MKSRGVYESPGVTILMHGHRAVEQLTLDREVMHLRDSLIPRYAEMVYNGYWFAPEREALQALIDARTKGRERRRAAEALQGRSVDRRTQVAELALRSADRELRGSRAATEQSDAEGFHPAGRVALTRAGAIGADEAGGGSETDLVWARSSSSRRRGLHPSWCLARAPANVRNCHHQMDVHITHPDGSLTLRGARMPVPVRPGAGRSFEATCPAFAPHAARLNSDDRDYFRDPLARENTAPRKIEADRSNRARAGGARNLIRGRFKRRPAAGGRSVHRLTAVRPAALRHDIRGSIAHAQMLARVGLLTRADERRSWRA